MLEVGEDQLAALQPLDVHPADLVGGDGGLDDIGELLIGQGGQAVLFAEGLLLGFDLFKIGEMCIRDSYWPAG